MVAFIIIIISAYYVLGIMLTSLPLLFPFTLPRTLGVGCSVPICTDEMTDAGSLPRVTQVLSGRAKISSTISLIWAVRKFFL